MNTETAERIDTLEDAKDHLIEAITLIESAVRGTDEERRAEAYILPHLRTWLDNSVASSYTSIEDLKAALIEECRAKAYKMPGKKAPATARDVAKAGHRAKAITKQDLIDELAEEIAAEAERKNPAGFYTSNK